MFRIKWEDQYLKRTVLQEKKIEENILQDREKFSKTRDVTIF